MRHDPPEILTRGAAVEPDTPSPETGISQEHIELVIPARAEYVAVVRLTVAGVAGRLGFSYDDIEDIKVAVSEACTVAVLSGGPKVDIEMAIRADRLDVRVGYQVAAGVQNGRAEGELAMLLIECLMDEVRTDRRGRRRAIRMAKNLRR
jgi:serine/threonine-protein kinase RsbW